MEAIDAKLRNAPPAPEATEPACCATKSSRMRGKPWLIGGAVLATMLALYLGWDWLAATGATGVLLSLAPCLAMCALGLCMRGKKHP